MSTNDFIATARQRLDTLRAKHRIPGAQLAILVDGEIHELASGILNKNTGVAVTTDSVFQSGSVAKVYTATAAMRLVDQGRLDLDAKVVDVLPEFGTPDAEATARITVRHLFCHLSGTGSEFHGHPNRGDDCVELFVRDAREVPMDLPPGVVASYSNIGIITLARIVEVITGEVWDDALKHLLFEPLGLKRSFTLTEDAVRYNVAMGHLGAPGAEPEPAEMWTVHPRAASPAAHILMSAGDMARFAKLHLDGGVAADGTRIMSAESVAAMREPQSVPVDRWSVSADAWGLGWSLYDHPNYHGFGHDGSAVSQHAMLRIYPEQGVALALMTNSGAGRSLYADLFPELLASLGITMPAPFGPADPPIAADATRFYGTYEREGVTITVGEQDGVPRFRYEFTGTAAHVSPPLEGELKAVAGEGDNVFSVRFGAEGSDEDLAVIFATHNDTEYVWIGMRATPRVS